jgi:hypothetical protein
MTQKQNVLAPVEVFDVIFYNMKVNSMINLSIYIEFKCTKLLSYTNRKSLLS